MFRTEEREETIDHQREEDYKLIRIKSEGPDLGEADLRAAKIKDLLQKDKTMEFNRELSHFNASKDGKVSIVQRLMREKLTVFQSQQRKK